MTGSQRIHFLGHCCREIEVKSDKIELCMRSGKFCSKRGICAIGVLLVGGLILLSIFVDRYWMRGRVESRDGVPIPSAAIIVTIRGDRPYVPVPHSRRRNSLCVASYVVETNEQGVFKLNRLAFKGPFISRYVTFSTFAEGWMGNVRMERVQSNMLGPPQFFKITLDSESMKRLSYLKESTYDEQRTRSAAFASLQDLMGTNNVCNASATPVLIKVVHRMAKISESEEERRLTLAYCRRLVESGADSLVCDESLFSGGNDVD